LAKAPFLFIGGDFLYGWFYMLWRIMEVFVEADVLTKIVRKFFWGGGAFLGQVFFLAGDGASLCEAEVRAKIDKSSGANYDLGSNFTGYQSQVFFSQIYVFFSPALEKRSDD